MNTSAINRRKIDREISRMTLILDEVSIICAFFAAIGIRYNAIVNWVDKKAGIYVSMLVTSLCHRYQGHECGGDGSGGQPARGVQEPDCFISSYDNVFLCDPEVCPGFQDSHGVISYSERCFWLYNPYDIPNVLYFQVGRPR